MVTLVVFAAAVVFGLLTTATARAVAVRVGLVDKPDGRRKTQDRPVAIAGGVGVLTATVLALLAGGALFPEIAAGFLADAGRPAALLAAAVVIAAVGLVDDAVELRARHKLVGQLAAVVILVVGGFRIDQVSAMGVVVNLEVFGPPVTVFWFLAAINALNLLDGMDGLLGTIGVIAVGTLAWMAFAVGHPFAGWVAVAVAGGLVGFLRFNLPPASVYLGDCGSMLIGLVVGALSIEASLKGPAVAIMVPAALLVLPILDTSAAIVRRKLTGRGLAQADRGHLHHVVQRRGLSRGRVLVLVAGLGGVTAGGALAAMMLQNDLFAALSALAVALILVATGLFGTAEVRLIRERAVSVYKSASARGSHVELTVRLQGTADWDGLWQRVLRAADDLGLHSVRLDVNAPALHEGFHGRWDRSGGRADALDGWRVDLPVYGHGQVIGRLAVAGVRGDAAVGDRLARLAGVFAEMEAVADRTIGRAAAAPRAPAASPPALPPGRPTPLPAPA